MANWRNKEKEGYKPELVAQEMEKTKILSDTGKVSFKGFESLGHFVLLNSMITLNEEVPEIEKRRMIRQAAFNAGAKGKITSESILNEVAKLERTYLSTTPKKFKLITEISISRSCQLPRVYYEGSCIVINARLDAATKKSRNELLFDAKRSMTSDLRKDYAKVSVSVTARSVYEAADKALDRLDFVRGLWNLWRNRGHSLSISSGRTSPVNRIILGPIHTLHNIDGTLAVDSWWYEPQYQGPVRVYDQKAKISGMYKYMANFRSLLKKSNYAPDIINAVLRYGRALDKTDLDYSFLRLWAVLELLTGTLAENYKVTVRRASSIFADREYTHQVLLHLREYRNKSVHSDFESSDIESLVYQLKRCVEVLIAFHLRYRFSSMPDAAKFMDIPHDKDWIDKQIYKLRYAKKLISGS